MSEWLIHRFECPECGAEAYADRPLGCWDCGAEMKNEDHKVDTIEK